VDIAAESDLIDGGVIHLEIGRPDFDTPPHIKEAAARALEKGTVHYTSNYGIPELRGAIAGKLLVDNQLEYDPLSEMIVTAGANEAIFLAVMGTAIQAMRSWCRIHPGYTTIIASLWREAER